MNSPAEAAAEVMDLDTDDLQSSGSSRPLDSSPSFGADEDLSSPPDVKSQPAAFTQTGRPCRNYWLPKQFQDILPSPVALPEIPDPPAPPKRTVLLVVRDRLITAANIFGIWRDYLRRPFYDPDVALTLEDLTPHPLICPSQLLSQNPVNTSGKLSAYWRSLHCPMYSWRNPGSPTRKTRNPPGIVPQLNGWEFLANSWRIPGKY